MLNSNKNKHILISSNDKKILTELAKKVQEISNRDEEAQKAKLWTQHNDLKTKQPLIFADPENGWNEIITSDNLFCTGAMARDWEFYLRKQIYWANEIKDDKVITDYFDLPISHTDSGWGLKVEKKYIEGGSYSVIPAIKNYDEDFPKLKFPKLVIDVEKTDIMLDAAHMVFDGILQVRQKTMWWWTLGLTYDLINLRSLDNFMMDLILHPNEIHKIMKFLSDGYIKRLEYLEQNKFLSLNTEDTYVGSGGFGWTDELPKYKGDTDIVSIKNMWGFCESQETVGVSPEMFAEFVLPYQIPILNKFGLNCYGCCEPIDTRWEYVKTIPNLRRVSASPWSDKKAMSEYLEDKYIMSAKLSPTPLASTNMDENVVRNEINELLSVTKDNVLELIMKDNHTLGNSPKNITRWVEIAKEEIGR